MSAPADPQTAIATALGAAVPDAELDRLVRDLRALHRGAALDFALAVGRMVVDRVYGGDLDAWRERGAKDGSFRRLAAKLDPLGIPGLSSGNLARAVAVLEVDARVGVQGRPQLTIAHVNAVSGLPAADQERLLGEAEARDLTAAELREEADAVRRAQAVPGRTGRPRLPPYRKTLNRWKRDLEDESGTFAGLDDVGSLDDDERAELTQVVGAMRARCEALLATLGVRGSARKK